MTIVLLLGIVSIAWCPLSADIHEKNWMMKNMWWNIAMACHIKNHWMLRNNTICPYLEVGERYWSGKSCKQTAIFKSKLGGELRQLK